MNETDIELPDVIRTYQSAHDRQDTETALAAFTADARVYDEDREYRGTDAIRGWLTDTATKYTYTRTPIDAEASADGMWLVRSRYEGNFPGGVVDLRHRFVLRDGLIADLAIAP